MKKCNVCDKELKLIGQFHTLMDCPDGDDGNTYKDYYECENGHKLIEIYCPNGSEPSISGHNESFKNLKEMRTKYVKN